jgi:hypothetical protein
MAVVTRREDRLTAYRPTWGLVGLLVLLMAAGARAGPLDTCSEQAAIAEGAAGIPNGLLLAIGKRETGRYDPRTGTSIPWPWSVNREGESHVFDTREEAVAYVADAQRAGYQSIDVGCFQINLKHHPTAFASLDEAFDPAANAAYAARFLRTLYERDGSWEAAVADYHSATVWLGAPYRDAVLAIWHGLALPAASVAFPAMRPTRIVMGIRIYELAAQPDTGQARATRAGEGSLQAHGVGKIVPMAGLQPVNGLPTVYRSDTALAAR